MDDFNWLKMGSSWQASKFCGEKSHTTQDLVSTELVQAAIFVFQLKSHMPSLRFFGIIFQFVVKMCLTVHWSIFKMCLTVSLSIFGSSAITVMPKWWLALKWASPFLHSHQCSLLLDRSFVTFDTFPSFCKPVAWFKHNTLDGVS